MNIEIPLIILAAAVFVFTATAMIWDLRTRRLPNWLTVGAFVGGVAFHIVTGVFREGAMGGLSGFGFAMGGFATGFGILLALWLIGGGGGGDVKLAGAVGAWLGAPLMVIAFVLSALLALLMTLGAMVYFAAKPAPAGAASRGASIKKTMSAGRQVPYAVPLTLATWTVLVFKSLAIVAQ